jgi:hypothetical protein
MSAQALQSLIGAALTDTNFRLALLNGSRQRVLQSFALSAQEVQTLMTIRADTLEQFASQAHQLLVAAGDEPQPLPRLRRGKRGNAGETLQPARGEPARLPLEAHELSTASPSGPLTLAVAEYVR